MHQKYLSFVKQQLFFIITLRDDQNSLFNKFFCDITQSINKYHMEKKLPTKSKVNKPKIQVTNAQMQQAVDQGLNINSQPVVNNPLQMPVPQMPIPQMQAPQMQMQMPTQVPQVQIQQSLSNNRSNVRGGVYGARQNLQQPQNANYDNQVFNDDEPIIQKVKEQNKDAKIQLQIKAQRSLVKLKTQTDLPAMVTLRTSGGSRTSVDLICVIDNSGSMNGQKIQLVKQTIRFLLQTLTPSDRLSIITFNSISNRLCGLKCVTGQNMQFFRNTVDGIMAGGGTNINSGLQLALKTIRQRKHVNKVTSIFLLSDGQDKGAQQTFKLSLQLPINKQLGVFTLHSFGFGTDHDQDLMTKLCQIKDGAFYFIKQLATLDEAFCNALGGIISLVASQVTMKISNIANNIVQGVKIKKVYGKMWQKINDKQYKIKLSQLMSGISKDYVFQIHIPSINTEVGDINRDHNIIQAIFVAKGLNNQNSHGEKVLEITLLNKNEQIPDTTQNVDVIENFLRVKATQAIQQSLKQADQQNYQQAQKNIDQMVQYIQQNKKARKQKMQSLVCDLNQIKQKCSKQDWQGEGRKWMKNAQQAHSMQNNYQYSNKVQSQMVSYRKAQKKM